MPSVMSCATVAGALTFVCIFDGEYGRGLSLAGDLLIYSVIFNVMSQDTIIIVPTYNERDNLVPLVERLLALPVAVDLLVVDDNSPDGTGHLADDLARRHSQIHVLHRPAK